MSEYGGRVYFDELGPPWPKHPCTDTSGRSAAPSDYIIPAAQPEKQFSWHNDGWDPAEILSAIQIEPFTILCVCRIDSEKYKFDIATKLDTPLGKDALFFIRETDNLGVFDISYLNTHPDSESVESCCATGYCSCYSPEHYGLWKSAVAGNPDSQNKIAIVMLFAEGKTNFDTISDDANSIDFGAIKYWFAQAASGGNRLAEQNLSTLDKLLLRRKHKGDTAFKRELFVE